MSQERGTSPVLRRGLVAAAAVLAGFAVLVAVSPRPEAAEKEEAPARQARALPADLDLVPRDAFGFLSFRVADVWTNSDVTMLREDLGKKNPAVMRDFLAPLAVGVDPSEVERLTFLMPKVPAFDDPNAQPAFAVFVATTKAYDIKKILKELMPDGKEEKFKGKVLFTSSGAAIHPISDRAYLLGPAHVVEDILSQTPPKEGKGPLSEALALAAEKHYITGGMNPAPLLKAVPPEAKQQEEFETFKPILEAQSLALAFDAGKELRLFGTLHCSGESEAKDAARGVRAFVGLFLKEALPRLKQELKLTDDKDKDLKKVMSEIETALEKATIEPKGSVVHMEAKAKVDLGKFGAALIAGLPKVRAVAEGGVSENNLKQLALAMHNYASTYGTFPPAAQTDKDGKALLSWRVLILPYIEEDRLYNEFKLNEPWDGPNNKKLIERMPKVFAVGDKAGSNTYYRVFHGKGAAFEGAKGLKIADFTDGTSNTLLIVEADTPVPWTKPDELEFDAKKDLPKLGGLDKDNFYAAFADGSVKKLPKTIDKDKLKAYITRNGGEEIKE
jgi:Protein of unknown function (DUF1559)